MSDADTGFDLAEIEAKWLQARPPSLWDGLLVRHYQSHEDSELPDCVTPSRIWMSVVKRPSDLFERKNQFGRWQKITTPVGTAGYVPSDFVLNGRWLGGAEAVCVLVDLNKLQGGSITPLPLINRPIDGLYDRIFAQLIDEIYKDSLCGAPAGAEHAEWLALSALYRLLAVEKIAPVECKVGREVVLIGRAVEYIHSHLDSSLRMLDIANASGFESNLYAFARLFKQHTGKTPRQYVTEARLLKSKAMLLQGKRTVTDVALACGFTNLSHFSDTFKKFWGHPPSSLITGKGIA